MSTDTAKTLEEKGYVKVENLINEQDLKSYCDFLLDYCENNPVAKRTEKHDLLSPDQRFISRHPVFEMLLEKLTPKVSEITGKTLLPTYSYGRSYKPGAFLGVHSDRDVCEYSMTLCLGRDGTPWPIYMAKDASNRGSAPGFDLDTGEALIYKGIDMLHWREEFEGEWQAQIFLHWVDADGPYADRKYEDRPHLAHYNQMNAKLSDFVVVLPNALTEDYCDVIVDEFKDHESFTWGNLIYKGDVKVDTSHRKVRELLITAKEVWDGDEFKQGILDNILQTYVNCIDFYNFTLSSKHISSVPVEPEKNEGIKLLHYKEGYMFNEHFDGGALLDRMLTCSINLSKGYKGARFKFFNGTYDVKLGKGDAIIFPSSFLWPHQVTELTEGERYSLITWFK